MKVRRALLVLAVAASVASPVTSEAAAPVASWLVRWSAAATATERAAVHVATGADVTGRVPALDLERIDATAAVAGRYRAHPLVDYVEPEPGWAVFDGPSDPLLALQWSFDLLRVTKAWRHETGARNPVLVAVVDTGVDGSHPDLAGRVRPGFDFVDADEIPQDNHGHGTHIAGVIAANADNQEGVAGISWGAKILPLRVCNRRGGCGGLEVAAGIAYAIASGARVVNLSLGGAGTECPETFALLSEIARQKDVLLVAATGNSAQNGNPVNYPAACPGYVGVGATDSNDDPAAFSSYGNYVDVAAPGVGIWSTLPASRSRSSPVPGYGGMSGTSMAAPHVAALAALLYSQNPAWTALQVEERIVATAVDLGRTGRDPHFGAGRIDVARAVGRGGSDD